VLALILNGLRFLVGAHACQVIGIVSALSRDQLNVDDDGTTRRASRRISDVDDDPNAAIAPALKRSHRNFLNSCKCCCDVPGLPKELRCSGCVHFKEFATKERHLYKSDKCQCYKAWTRKPKDVVQARQSHWLAVKNYIDNNLEKSMLSNQNDPIMDDVDDDESVNNLDDDEDEEVVITAAKTTTTTPPSPQKKRGITCERNVFKSG